MYCIFKSQDTSSYDIAKFKNGQNDQLCHSSANPNKRGNHKLPSFFVAIFIRLLNADASLQTGSNTTWLYAPCSALCHLFSHEVLLMLPQSCHSPRALWVGSKQRCRPREYLLPLQIDIPGWWRCPKRHLKVEEKYEGSFFFLLSGDMFLKGCGIW